MIDTKGKILIVVDVDESDNALYMNDEYLFKIDSDDDSTLYERLREHVLTGKEVADIAKDYVMNPDKYLLVCPLVNKEKLS